MRSLVLAVLLASVPGLAAGQSGPRSLTLELGFAHESAEQLGDRIPVGLCAGWWLTGDLDATARAVWTFASRTGGRAATGAFEAGAGVRYAIATWPTLRPHLMAELAFVQVLSAPASELWTSDAGVRLGVGSALELLVARDLSLILSARATELLLVSGEGGPGLAVAFGIAGYF